MKKTLILLLAVASLALTGCISRPGNIVAVKSTTFGFDVSGDPNTNVPHVRLGLIRNFYQVIPTSTNAIYAPSYATSMSAEMRLTSQRGQEDFSSGEAATLSVALGATNNTVAKIGAGQENIKTPAFAPLKGAATAPPAP